MAPGHQISTKVGPGQRLRDCPTTGAFPVKAEGLRQTIEPSEDAIAAVAQFRPANHTRDREFALANQRLGINYQPRLALRLQHIVSMQILVHQHLRPLGRYELAHRPQRGIDQPPFDRPAASPGISSLPMRSLSNG